MGDLVRCLLEWLRGRWEVCVLFPAGAPPLGASAVDAVCKLARHFARLGFAQVGTCGPQLNYWFLASCSAALTASPKSKAETAEITVSLPRKPIAMEPIDKELRDLCLGADGLHAQTDAPRVAPRCFESALCWKRV